VGRSGLSAGPNRAYPEEKTAYRLPFIVFGIPEKGCIPSTTHCLRYTRGIERGSPNGLQSAELSIVTKSQESKKKVIHNFIQTTPGHNPAGGVYIYANQSSDKLKTFLNIHYQKSLGYQALAILLSTRGKHDTLIEVTEEEHVCL